MAILKSYKFRLYPSNDQEILINKTFGCSRFIYNYFLEKCKNYKYTSAYDMCRQVKELYNEYPWLKEVDSCSLRNSIFNLEDSYKNFFDKRSHYPIFKTRKRLSYKTNNIINTYYDKIYNSISIDLAKRIIKLPKLKEVKIRGYRNLKEITGRILNCTISKEADKYYVSVLVESNEIKPKNEPKNIIGIDLGIKNLIITSNGETIKNKHIVEKYEKKIKGLNKWLSRCKKGSKNRYKVIKKLQIVYRKLRNARKYNLHEISNKIIKENDIIAVEKLQIKEMLQNKNLSKKIIDVSWYELIRQLEYKSKWKNKEVYQIDTYYASSQTCSRCGYKENKVKDLSIRKWECPNCSNQNDRDINAAINIMFEGIKIYMKKGLRTIVN